MSVRVIRAGSIVRIVDQFGDDVLTCADPDLADELALYLNEVGYHPLLRLDAA